MARVAVGIPSALTGPIARGDVATVRLHIERLATGLPEAAALYRTLGRWCVRVARAKGTLSDDTAEGLAELFRGDAGVGDDA